MGEYIKTSVFDVFKTGPGPSSSHTIGPMKAALDFRHSVQDILSDTTLNDAAVDVCLYGSLSLTGEGHGTHKAVLGGLMGWAPETCDCDRLLALLDEPGRTYEITFAENPEKKILFTAANIHFEGNDDSLPFQNTVRFRLSEAGETVLEKEYYSVGGGFIRCKGEAEAERPDPPYGYSDMNGLRKQMRRTGLSLSEIMLSNEAAITGKSRDKIFAGLDDLIGIMCGAVENGLKTDGILPGPIGLMRKAQVLYKNSAKLEPGNGLLLGHLNAFAMAASEENAAGRKVVTAPTSGAAGVIPGIIFLLKTHYKAGLPQLRDGMLAAAAIAFIAKHNASIAGAEVGCQGEVGVASSMAAAFVAHANGLSMKQVENAAEIALEHHLGMTCDPVGGYVQIPCIERNAVGAVTAINAYILAAAGDPARQKVTFDEVVEAMMETGRDMSKKYKETSRGGLAVCCVSC
ncbi:L-serine ammonia-lyase [Desulfonema ishimotonii]|uniref:L-serine dehydratase n=1 Tax=Desulfonema ishimotonii TaxID=45657 RepID=A0A401FU48_9BACT|nr:L-serine ammonia-lyase [Desulfonema ishimotonii]GBC60483.1 L-serine ammonia-lyase [Desulfonema ishimotonii]